jgi:PST family polysaccharide transporter
MSVASSANLAQRSLTALVWSYTGAGGRAMAQLLIQILLARHLGPEAFGQATAAMFVLAVGWLLAEGGFGAALVQRAQVSDADIAYALGWVLLLSIIAGGLVAALARPIAALLGDRSLSPLVLVCGLLIPLQAVTNVPASLMRRQLDMKRLQVIQVGGYVVAYGVVGLWLASAGAGAWSLVAAFGVHSLVVLAGTCACVRLPWRLRLSGDSALRRFGLAVVGTNVANWFIDNVDRLVINRYWGATALGEYTAASNLSRAPASLLVSSSQSVTLAAASRVQGENQRVARGYLAVCGLVWLVCAPTFVWLALHAELVVHTLYGERWAQAAPLFAAFCVGLPFYALLSVTGPTLWAVGAVRSELKSQIFIAACLLAGFLALTGQPLAVAVWLVPLLYALRLLLVYRSLAVRIELSASRMAETLIGGTLLAVLAACGWWLSAALQLHGLRGALAGAVAALVLAVIALRIAPRSVVPLQLRQALLARTGESVVLAYVCRWLGLEERVP